MIFKKPLVILLLCLLTIPVANAAVANAAEHGKKAAEGEKKPKVVKPTPTHILIRPFMAPVRVSKKKGRWSSNARTITVFLKYKAEENVAKICQLEPRITDSLMTTLSYNPIPLTAKNRLDTSGIDAILLKSINKAIGEKLISEVYILDGKKRKSKKAAHSLPFSSAKCSALQSEIKKKNKGKGEGGGQSKGH